MNFYLNIMPYVVILVMVVIVILCLISYYESKKIQVTQCEVRNKKIPKAFHNYKIIHISDLHNAEFGKGNEGLIKKIRALNPDIIIISGDMVVAKPKKAQDIALDFINALAEEYPIYYGYGNHEYRMHEYTDIYEDMWDTYKSTLSKKIYRLTNAYEEIKKREAKIKIHGLNMDAAYYRRLIRMPMVRSYLESVLGKNDEASYHILIAHNPDYFKEYLVIFNAVATVCSLPYVLWAVKKKKIKFVPDIHFLKILAILAIIQNVFNIIYTIIVGQFNSALFFPITGIASTLAVVIFSRIFLKEKLSRSAYIGVFLSIVAITLLSF